MKKRIMLLLSICMLFTLIFGAVGYADEDTYQYAKLTKESAGPFIFRGLEKDQDLTIQAYKILEPVFDGDYFTGYAFVKEVKDWMQKQDEYKDFVKEDGYQELGKKDKAYQNTLYSKLATQIQKGTISEPVATFHSNGVEEMTQYLPFGQYMFITRGGEKVWNPSTATSKPSYNSEGKYWEIEKVYVGAKGTVMTFDKRISKNNSPRGYAGLGDKFTYVLKGTIPDYPEGSIKNALEVKDEVAEGIDYIDLKKNLKVTNGNRTVVFKEGADNDYVVEYTEGSHTFTIKFNYEKIRGNKDFTISYDAQLNENAKIGVEGNSNKAYYTFYRYPTFDAEEGNITTLTDNADMYSFGLVITKQDATTTYTKLAGAIFILEKKITSKQWDPVTRESGEFITNKKGELFINYLAPGTYRFKEVQAPGGYNLDSKYVEFTITNSKSVGVAYGDKYGQVLSPEGTYEDDGYYRVTVSNTKTILPGTGSVGTTIFTVVGIIIMFGAVVYLVIRKRMTVVR